MCNRQSGLSSAFYLDRLDFFTKSSDENLHKETQQINSINQWTPCIHTVTSYSLSSNTFWTFGHSFAYIRAIELA